MEGALESEAQGSQHRRKAGAGQKVGARVTGHASARQAQAGLSGTCPVQLGMGQPKFSSPRAG